MVATTLHASPKRHSDHPSLTVADTAAQGRHRVWMLMLLALMGVAVPLGIGGYALRQAAASQRMLIESTRLAHADVMAAHVSGALMSLRKDVISLSKDPASSAALSLKSAAMAQRVLDAAHAESDLFRALQLTSADDSMLAVSPRDAQAVFAGNPVSPDSPKSMAAARRDGKDVVWVVRFTVRDANGKRVGSVAAASTLGGILRAQALPSLGKTGATSLLDTQGNVLASTNESLLGKRYQAPEILEALRFGKRAVSRHHSFLQERNEFSALVPVVQAPIFVVLGQAAKEVNDPVALLERWLWLLFLALTLSSAGMFWHALRTFRHFDRRLIRECSLATGVIDGTSDMVFVKDAEGRYLLVNEPGAAFLHHSREEIVGHTDAEVMDPGIAAQIRKNDKEVLDTGRPTKREFFGVDPVTGKSYVVWTARHPLRDKQGAVAAVVGVTRDVTERHRMIDALREGEQRLRLIADNLPALVAYVDREERYRFANKTLEESLGAGSASVIGRTLLEVRGEELYDGDADHVATVLAGELVTFEGRYSDRGRQHIYRSTYVPDLSPDGEVRGFYAMTFDITDLKTVEVLLAASEAKLRLIADNLPALVSYIDRERRFVFNNAAYVDWLSRPLGEITGKLIADVADAELLATLEPHLYAALEGRPVEFEFAWAQRHFRGTYIPDNDELDGVVGVYGLIYDITAQKATEMRLRQQARIDPLTGLPNRRRFNESLAEAIARSERYGHALAVMYVDMDHLKRVNDTFGHEGGDLALKEFARRLLHSVRSTDTVARVAGDEFVIVIESIESAATAAEVAGHIVAAMATPFELLGQPWKLSASMGIALRHAGETDGDELLRRADHALYAMKSSGRGGFVIHE